ncbi:SSU ribosomal protein S9P [Rickenella mellea]|uniref:SSU ribosomal protein S9P n=1 Tax=Rickenella mellea TaxID=50990 RepID=A0A4Y7QFC4_9AGAM|nr:SSU ribosomal protein S9P [Rickenella mellea]
MNHLLRFRPSVFTACRRSFATQQNFVPPKSLEAIDPSSSHELAKPVTPTFYTGRSSYYESMGALERAVQHSRQMLTTLNIFPLPPFALEALPPLIPVWKSKEKLNSALDTKLSATRYRRMLALLNELNHFRRIAKSAGHDDVGSVIQDILDFFERDDKEEHLKRGRKKPVKFDEYGRSYTLGRRKESSARVWMIASHNPPNDAQRNSPPPTSQILINNVPLNKYFPLPGDRERILAPFKVTGTVGAYNVFTLVRGGGSTGQSGAIAHGIATGLAGHAPDLESILRRAKLTRRDPRMVERKKTNRAKARKGYGWVKR